MSASRSEFMQKILVNKAFSKSETLPRKGVDSVSLGRRVSLDSAQQKSQIYIPINYIQPEVRTMFRSWELIQKDECRLGESNTKAVTTDCIEYDSLRAVSPLEPPKYFSGLCWGNGAHRSRRNRRNGQYFAFTPLCQKV